MPDFSLFHFLNPLALWLLVPLFILIGLKLWFANYGSQNIGKGIIAPHLINLLITDTERSSNTLPTVLALIITTLGIIALAQPVWKQKGADPNLAAPLVLIIDSSSSMNKDDIAPTRIERAQFLLTKAIERGITRPIALVAMAGSAHILMPPTTDTELLKLYLSYLSPSVMPIDGNDLSPVVKLLHKTSALNTSGTDVVLVTDGVTEGFNDFKKYVKSNDIELAVLSFTQLGRQTGSQLGAKTITGDSMSGTDLALTNTINRFTATPKGEDAGYQDEMKLFFIPLLLLLMNWFRKGWTLNFAVCLIFLMSPVKYAQADGWDYFFTPDQKGRIFMELGRYKEAATAFQSPGWKATACYYSEQWDCAITQYAKVGDNNAIFNMANSSAQDGQYLGALNLYLGLKQIAPDFPGLDKNLDIVAKLVKEYDDLAKNDREEKPPNPNEKPPKKAQKIAHGSGKKKGVGEIKRKLLSADEVLKSQSATDKWLRDISRDPKSFIKQKFQAEYNEEMNSNKDGNKQDEK